MLSETRYEHIYTDAKQVPMIAGTNMKVIELALDHLVYVWSPEELRFQHPYLTMGQIHSALAYYWDLFWFSLNWREAEFGLRMFSGDRPPGFTL